MKKLFKLGMLSLLMGSLVVSSGCYKKDIDDLEKRLNALEITIEDHTDALDVLEVLTDGAGVITNFSETADEYRFTITRPNGDSPSTVIIPRNTGGGTEPEIVTGYKNEAAYYEFTIGGTHTVRIGKNFNKAVTSLEVLGTEVSFKTTAGQKAYVIIDVNPANYTLTTDVLSFDAVMAPVRAVAGVTGLEEGVTLTKVTRSTDMSQADWDTATGPLGAKISQVEGRWVLEFAIDAKTDVNEYRAYKVFVEYPADASEYNGIWPVASTPAAPAVKTTYTNGGYFNFSDQAPTFITGSADPNDDTSIGLQTAASVGSTAVTTATMLSDGTTAAVITINNYNGDPNVYLTAIKSVTATNASSGDLTTLATYLVADNSVATDPAFTDGTGDIWKNVNFHMVPDTDMDDTVFPVGSQAVYTISYTTSDGSGNNITTNTFTLTVTRVQLTTNVATADQIGNIYLPATTQTVNYGTIAAPVARAAGDEKIYQILTRMGYTTAQIATATYTGLTVMQNSGTTATPITSATWSAYTGPADAFTTNAVADTATDLVLTINKTALDGQFQLAYNFVVAGKNVTIYDYVRIVFPTIYVELKDATIQHAAGYDDRETTAVESVEAVKYFANTNAPVPVADLLNLTQIQIGLSYENSAAIIATEPANAYSYDRENNQAEIIGGNTYGLRAIAQSVALNNDGKAERVKLFVKLTTGQELPVVVNPEGTAAYTASGAYAVNHDIPDWDGAFYVAAQGNGITDFTLQADTYYNFDMVNIIPTQADISDLITTVTLKDGTTTIDSTTPAQVTDPANSSNTASVAMTAYQKLMRDPRIASIEVTPVPLTDPTIETTELITTPTGTTTETTTGATPDFDYELDHVYVKGITGVTAWDNSKIQSVDVKITDVFGNTVTKRVAINLTHTGA